MAYNNTQSILQYYSRKASSYNHRLSKMPWRFLRDLEINQLKALMPDLQGLRVIDACCGSGLYSHLMVSKNAKYCLSVDFVEEMTRKINHPQIETHIGDFAKLKTPREYDYILCAGGLEFFANPADFFKAADLNTNSQGKLLVLYPPLSIAGLFYWLYHCCNNIKIHLFRKKMISRLAKASNWSLVSNTYIHPFARAALYEKK